MVIQTRDLVFTHMQGVRACIKTTYGEKESLYYASSPKTKQQKQQHYSIQRLTRSFYSMCTHTTSTMMIDDDHLRSPMLMVQQ